METRFDGAQQHIAQHSKLIIEYLTFISSLFPHHLGEAVSASAKGRLFFKEGISLSEEMQRIFETIFTGMEVLFHHEHLLAEFEKLFSQWQPVVTEENIQSTKQQIIEYFFLPLEQSDLWNDFWTLARERLAKHFSPEHLETESTKIRDKIAGAFTYKISSAWSHVNEKTTRKNIDKLSCFTKMINYIGEPQEMLSEQKNKTIKMIANALTDLTAHLKEPQTTLKSTHEIEQRVKMCLEQIRADLQFQALEDSEQILQKQLQIYIAHLQTLKMDHKKYVIKKTAETILRDINEYQFNRFQQGTASTQHMDTVEKTLPLIGKKAKAEFSDLLKCEARLFQSKEKLAKFDATLMPSSRLSFNNHN